MPDAMIDQAVRIYGSYLNADVMYLGLRYDYGNRRRGMGFEESSFLDSLRQTPANIVAVDTGLVRSVGVVALNRLIREVAHWYTPRVVFCVLHRDEVALSTLDALRASGSLVINWFTDDQWRYDDFSRAISPHLDLAVTTSASAFERYISDGLVTAHKSQWACNTRLFRPVEVSSRYQVGFAGQVYGRRAATIAALRHDGFEVQVRGLGWPRGRGTLQELVQAICEARVFVNFGAALTGKHSQIKGRDFEVPGCGGVLVTDSGSELRDFFRVDKEIIQFAGYGELRDKLTDLLRAPERLEQIAAAGLERVRRDHTYVRRLRAAFSDVGVSLG